MPCANKYLQRRYQRLWLRRRRAAWIESQGGVCSNCGDPDRLEIHHTDPKAKVTHRIWSWSHARREAELAKCKVLCHDCHVAETRKQYNGRPWASMRPKPAKRASLHSLTINQLLQRQAK